MKPSYKSLGSLLLSYIIQEELSSDRFCKKLNNTVFSNFSLGNVVMNNQKKER